MIGMQEQEVGSRMGLPMARYRIKKAAQERNISLKTIATRAKLSDTRLRDVANNRVPNVTVRFLEAVAATIPCTFGELFEPETLDQIPAFPPPLGKAYELSTTAIEVLELADSELIDEARP